MNHYLNPVFDMKEHHDALYCPANSGSLSSEKTYKPTLYMRTHQYEGFQKVIRDIGSYEISGIKPSCAHRIENTIHAQGT